MYYYSAVGILRGLKAAQDDSLQDMRRIDGTRYREATEKTLKSRFLGSKVPRNNKR